MADDVNVIIVDPDTQTVREKVIKNKLKTLQKIVGGPIEGHYGLSEFWDGHFLYMGEEARIRKPRKQFVIRRDEGVRNIQVMGPAVIMGLSSRGEQSHRLSLADVADCIVFLNGSDKTDDV